VGGWCKERYNKDENNKLEGLHQKPDQMAEARWEGQNFSEVVAPQEEEEEEEEEEEVKIFVAVLYKIYYKDEIQMIFYILSFKHNNKIALHVG
jgi:hypothetical protein